MTHYRRERLRYRTRFYYTTGVALIGMPITFFGLSRNIYSIIDSLPFMNILFPAYQDFLIRGGIALIPGCILVGFLWTKTRFYRAGFEVPAEENPFAYKLRPGREIFLKPLEILNLDLLLRLYREHNLLTEEEEAAFNHGLALHRHMMQGGDLREMQPSIPKTTSSFCEKEDT